MKYIVQVWNGEKWDSSRYGGANLAAAECAERILLKDDSCWVNPKAPRKTRITITD